MDPANLLLLIEAHEKVEQELKASSLTVWAGLSEIEPELAREVLHLFSTVNAAAGWVSTPVGGNGMSPAREAAEGRVAEVFERVRRAAYGFVA
jgi:hypothetical protein